MMSAIHMRRDFESEGMPEELARLRAGIERLPAGLRAELEPLADGVIEEAIFRGRVLNVAKEALERFRLDLSMTKFDLEVTRREREELRRRVDSVSR